MELAKFMNATFNKQKKPALPENFNLSYCHHNLFKIGVQVVVIVKIARDKLTKSTVELSAADYEYRLNNGELKNNKIQSVWLTELDRNMQISRPLLQRFAKVAEAWRDAPLPDDIDDLIYSDMEF